jgi:hypothetical protein
MTSFNFIYRKLLIFLPLVGLICCLEPEGTNYVDIVQPDPAVITISLSEVEDDTIYIPGHVRFTYQVNGYPVKITEAKVKIGTFSIFAPNYDDHSFDVYPQHVPIPSGFYHMTVQLTCQTENGSLEDRMGVKYELTRSFPVIVDIAPATPRVITLDSADGTLKVHWEKYTGRNFKSYVFYKNCGSGSVCVVQEITNPNITSYHDTQYTAGPVMYHVDVNTVTNTSPGVWLNYFWKPKVTTTVENNRPKMLWKKPLYYNNIKKITAHFAPDPSFEAPIDDITYMLQQPPPFGIMQEYYLTYETSIPQNSFSIGIIYDAGTTYYNPVEKPSMYNQQENIYYGMKTYGEPGMSIYDEDMNILKSDGHMFRAISQDGEHLYTIISNGFYRTNPRTFETTLRYQAVSQNSIDVNFVVGNNEFAGYRDGGKFFVVDLVSGTEKYASPGVQQYARLSPSGTWFINDARQVFRYNGSTFVLDGTLPSSFGISKFIFLNNDRIASIEGSNIIIYNGNDLSVIGTITNTSPNTMQYDPVSNRILSVSFQGYSSLINPDTHEVFPISHSLPGLTLLNGKLFYDRNSWILTVDHTYIEQP